MRWVLGFGVDGCVSEGDEERLNMKEALVVAEAIQEGFFFFFFFLLLLWMKMVSGV